MKRLALVAILLAAPLAFAGDAPSPEVVVPIDAIDTEALDSLRAKVEAHRAAGAALEARLHEVLTAIAKKHNAPLERIRVDLARSRLTIAPLASAVAPVTTQRKP